ncbi:PD-(D/E)XK nuclease family transposase [Fibrobacter sp. UWH6]|uniref:PD-(D/E)XK nuclease family transposase n=2 Tax=unclassified Fibrobacter TaxID=2634177 RepID=UPI00092062B5|nr:PD-(D/E)XK nuclease family transposase [Fibrobacter sp. UWH6]OWV07652.1 hypothetical protein B7993_02080 [Fibrobacter sp. UWH3]SHK56342.1 conserved hypothetical protein (putative transposase or invertase) [Fibrobacter sp. UWH6]
MNLYQMSHFLEEIHDAKKNGGDIHEIIERYHRLYKYVYIYNDLCAKEILTGGGKDLSLVTNLANAALRLTGSDCISNPTLENPVVSGGYVYKDIEEDILISRRRLDEKDEPVVDRIGLEIQHVGYDAYNNRLLFYVARHVGNMLKKGDFYDKMQNVHIISFQMFDYLPWKVSKRYVHNVRLLDDEYHTFSNQQTLTIVEVNKFLTHADTDYAQDDSRLAQWLRAIDALNNNDDFSTFVNDRHFQCLQKYAEVSTFAPELFVKAGEHMKDDVEVAAYIARKEGREEERAKYEVEKEEMAAKFEARIRELEALLAQKG